MAVVAGRHRLGPDRGRILLRTFRDGLAAQAGHDLTIEATRWSGELVVNDDLSPASLEVRADLGALVVRDGTGGVKPLTATRRLFSPRPASSPQPGGAAKSAVRWPFAANRGRCG